MKKIFSLYILFFVGSYLQPTGIIDEVTKRFTKTGLFDPMLEEKRKFLAELQKELTQLQTTQAEFIDITEKEIASVGNQLALVKEDLRQQPEDEFLLKKQSILNKRFQVLKDKIKIRKQLIDYKNELIKVVSDFLADPNLEEFKKEQKLIETAAYTFEDIQNLKQKALDAEKNISFIENQEKNVNAELESRKRIAASLAEEFKKKTEEFNATMKANAQPFEPDKRQIRELFALEEKLYKDEEELEQLRLNGIETRRILLKRKKIVATVQLTVLKNALTKAKQHIRLTKADIDFAKDEHAKKQRDYYNRLENFSKELERRKSKKPELEALSRRLNIPLGSDLDDWSREPKQTVDGYVTFFEVGVFNDQVLLVQREKELLEVRMDLEREQLEFNSLLVTIKETYYKIIANQFKSAEEVTEEINRYDALKTRSEATISKYEGLKNTAVGLLDEQKRAIENIKEHRKEIEKQTKILFKNYGKEYSRVISLLNSIEENILKQINAINKIIEVDSEIITINNNSLRQINLIVPDLPGTLQLSRRPEAVSWEALRSVIPDSRLFITDLNTYITTLSVESLGATIKIILDNPYELFLFFFKLLLLIVLLFLLRIYIPQFMQFLRTLDIKRYWLKLLIIFVSFLSSFFITYFIGIAIWLMLLLMFYNLKVLDPYLMAFFYLGSIPYFLYLTNRFIKTLVTVNEQEGYCFIQEQFQRRFAIIFSLLIYSTICISFFREAFCLISDPKSEVSRTLGALNLIILQLSVIFLLSRELVVYLIPTTTEISRAIRNFVDRYYYLILPFVIAIIIMSNPYVGYGMLVLYILSRLFYTAFVIVGLFWIHKIGKRISAKIFFLEREEVVKERFAYAKTWYGLFVIIVFVALILIGLFIGAKIWGWPEPLAKITGWKEIREWIHTPIALKDTESPLSIASIIQLLLFIFAGIITAYAFNRFVFGRIFDVLLIDPGVQHAITTIARYLIIFTALVLGFQTIGLQWIWIFLLAVLFTINWVVKDPVRDFVAYMLILVERPLKIGDYVKLDEETCGVVRKITPRLVILRRKNSTTYIVPNSQIMTKVLVNWNYRPGFVAFDDINITIPFKDDPGYVRDLMLQVLDENPYILKNPKPIIRLDNFVDYGYMFMVRGYVSSNYTLEIWNIASTVRIDLVRKLHEHNITLAVPIRKIIDGIKNNSID